MKKLYVSMGLALFILASGCSTVDQNIKARKNIQKCKFEFHDFKLDDVKFKGVKPEEVSFFIYLKITNPTADDVVLDHVEADIYLDENKTTSIKHKKFLRIKPKTPVVEKIAMELPASALLNLKGKRPQDLTLDAQIFVNVLIGSFTLDTNVMIPVKKTFPIPWDKIDAKIDQHTKGLTDKAGKAGDKAKDKTKDMKKKLKKKF
jgi:LEA14-like dessication related protein